MKIIAFDVFGTVVDVSSVSRDEIRDYVSQVRREVYEPLNLPHAWQYLPAFPDSARGIERLRKKFFVVTLSNFPIGLLAKLSKHAKITWDAIIPLELKRVYKPNPESL